MSEAGEAKLMSVREAMEVIDRAEVRPRVVRMSLGDADGARLAKDVLADRDYPPFAKSLMDGYAVRTVDVIGRSALSELRVIGEVAAGSEAAHRIAAGEAMAIMTGAPLPLGADGVIPVEEIERPNDSTVRILRPGQPARLIAARGSDCPKGMLVLKRGTPIGPQQAAVLATVGAWEVEVFDRPSVAILSTGNELAGAGDDAGASGIRNSNGPMLAALLRRMGCRVTDLGVCRDEPDRLREKLAEGLSHDAFFVSGGMSMGVYDYVPKLLSELGVAMKITKLRIKPGKPFVYGSTPPGNAAGHAGPGCHVFGLPGNPVSAFVCTIRLASRLLDRLAGGEVAERWQSGRLEVGMIPNGPREFYQPVIRTNLAARNSSQSVIASIRPLTWKGSADLFTLATANALLVRAENEPALPMGTVVRVLEI